MPEMKPFAVTIAVRNNLLKERRLALGVSQRELADKIGVGHHVWNELEAMRASPLRVLHLCRAPGCGLKARAADQYRCSEHRSEESMLVHPLKKKWGDFALKISEFFECEPGDLWPSEIIAVSTPKVEVKMDAEDVAALSEAFAPIGYLSPDDAVVAGEMRERLESALLTLTPREEKVLRLRFGIGGPDHTLEEIGSKVGAVSRERVRMIEQKALRKLRHPSRADRLRALAAVDGDSALAADDKRRVRISRFIDVGSANKR